MLQLREIENNPNKTEFEKSLARAKRERLEEAIALKNAQHELQKVANNSRSSAQAKAAAQTHLAANREAIAKLRGGPTEASTSTAAAKLPVSERPAPTALTQVEGRRALTGPEANAKSFPISRETRADGKQVEYSPVFNNKGEVVPGIAAVKVAGENVSRVDALPGGYKIDGNGVITKGHLSESSALTANGALSLGNGNYALTYQGGNSTRLYADNSGTVKTIGTDGRITPTGNPSTPNGVVTVSSGESGSSAGSALGLRAQGTKSSLVTLEKVATPDDYTRARVASPTASAAVTAAEVARTNDPTAGTPIPGTGPKLVPIGVSPKGDGKDSKVVEMVPQEKLAGWNSWVSKYLSDAGYPTNPEDGWYTQNKDWQNIYTEARDQGFGPEAAAILTTNALGPRSTYEPMYNLAPRQVQVGGAPGRTITFEPWFERTNLFGMGSYTVEGWYQKRKQSPK